MKHLFRAITWMVLSLAAAGDCLRAEEWSIALAGNTFRTAPSPGGNGFRRGGGIAWSDEEEVYSIYFHVDRAATLELALVAAVPEGSSSILARVGDQKLRATIEGVEFAQHELGKIKIEAPGYIRIDLQGEKRVAKIFAEIRTLVVKSDSDKLTLDYVKTDEGNMYYWGRRGASVHLSYQVPRETKLQYGYTEITVPEGEDTIGSYFMANGFAEGYFGIQVNSEKERRILFSVWSPFSTDNPKEIPEDQRIVALASGPEVHLGEFGNEGSGGQSFLVHPWKAGTTYRFLTEVKPDGQGRTVYTSWFGDKAAGEWRLIASFRRPKTETHLRGFHSFLENFDPAYGHVGRRARYENVWVRDVEEQWHECTQARFSVDATGSGQHRIDFTGGSKGKAFFLRNCGFFNETGKPDETFTRDSTADLKPEIDFKNLPRK